MRIVFIYLTVWLSILYSQIVYRVPIEGTIDLGLPPFIERSIKEAESNSADAIVFEINTFGGRVDAATQIKDAIMDSRVKTVAFINKRAISAMKQSLKAFLPRINDIVPMKDLMKICSNDENLFSAFLKSS